MHLGPTYQCQLLNYYYLDSIGSVQVRKETQNVTFVFKCNEMCRNEF